MTRYLIEVPHGKTKSACERAVKMFLETGSHFMTNADWGCADDEHKAWIIVDLETKQEAKSMVPPMFRDSAKVITLQRFGVDTLDETVEMHEN
jgi:hypothetical protein